jgi:zinc protease
MALHDLPDDYYSTFVQRVLAIDEASAVTAAARHLHPERMLAVVVGDRDRIGASLETLGLGECLDLGN